MLRRAITVLLVIVAISGCAMTHQQRENTSIAGILMTLVGAGAAGGTIADAQSSGTDVSKPGVAVLSGFALAGLITIYVAQTARMTDGPREGEGDDGDAPRPHPAPAHKPHTDFDDPPAAR